MNKKIKKAVIASLTVLPVAAVGGLAACGKKGGGKEESPQTYTVTVGDPQGGDITADKDSAVSGAQVTVTVSPDEGYELSYVTINGETVPISEFEDDNAYTFEMPAENVTIECGFTAMKGAITVEKAVGGGVLCDKTQAAAGETVTLTVNPDFGYELKSLKVNGEALTVKDGKATFTMPNTAAKVTAEFAFAAGAAVEAVPAVKAFSALKSKAAAGDTATADYTVVFGDDAVTVTAYVQDKKVLAEKDGIALYFGVRGYQHTELDETNKYVKVTADGTIECGAVKDGDWAAAESFATVGAAPWGKTDAAIDGYKITVKVPYSALDMADKAAALGNLTVMPVLLNSDNSFAATEGTLEDCDKNIPTTYPVFTADNKYIENEYKDGIGALGSGADVNQKGKWNLWQDYCKEDTEHYANRKAVLEGSEGDNDIVFYREKGDAVYAEATFKLDGVVNDEKFGKFGLMLYDGGDTTGLFYYVDAVIGNGIESKLENISGRALGYNLANGGWGGWNAINGAGEMFDLDTKTITLKMAYADNIISLYCEKEGEDILVSQMYYAAKGDVQIGIKSFNYLMTVSDYTVTSDKNSEVFKAHNPAVKQEEVDVLFCGDSYMDLLKSYDLLTAPIAKKANEGVGGTTVNEWSGTKADYLKLRYAPDKAVFHLGVNDINGGTSVDDTYNGLVAMFEEYHAAFADAQLYWVSIIPNDFNTAANKKYSELNAKMKAYAKDTGYLTYIDTETAFTAEDGGARSHMFTNDGLHLSSEYGYPMWTALINKALGYTVPEGSDMGISPAGYASTGGWAFEDDGVSENSGSGEAAAFYKGFGYATDFYFEADLTSKSNFGGEQFPKIGITMRNDDESLFAYIDLTPAGSINNVNVVYRDHNQKDGGGNTVWDFNWGAQAGEITTKYKDITTETVKLGVAKIGAKLYVTIDGVVVKEVEGFHGMTADTKYALGVMGFNRQMTVSNVKASNVKAEAEYYVKPSYTVSAATYNNVAIDFDNAVYKAKEGDKVSFAVNTDRNVTAVKVTFGAGEPVTLTEVDGKYSFDMGAGNAYVTLEFDDAVAVNLGGFADKIEASNYAPESGTEITFTAKGDFIITKLVLNDGTNDVTVAPDAAGAYKYTPTTNITVVDAEVAFTKDGIVLDGVLDDQFGDLTTQAQMSENREMKVWAVKTDSGVWIYSTAIANTAVTEKLDVDNNWHTASNFEFALLNGDQRYINIVGDKKGVTQAHYSYKQITEEGVHKGKYLHTVEIFVANEDIATNVAELDKIQLNYAWKHRGEQASYTSATEEVYNYAAQNDEWWSRHAIGGVCGDYITAVNGFQGRPANLFITQSGLIIGDGQAHVDCDFTKYAGKQSVTVGDANIAELKVEGYAADDGLHLGLTITHVGWNDAINFDNWSLNSNIEIRINGVHSGIIFDHEGNLHAGSMFAYGNKAVTVDKDGKKETKVELFVPGANKDQYHVQFGMAGTGFGGWQPLIWDNNIAVVDKDGVRKIDRNQTATSRATLDGVFDDDIYTNEVKNNAVNLVVNGASVSIMGVKDGSGVYLAFKVIHKTAPTQNLKNDGTAWWHFLNIEFRISGRNGNGNEQIWLSSRDNDHFSHGGGGIGKELQGGYKSVDNGDGTYTTTFEAYIPAWTDWIREDADGSVRIFFGGVIETDGFDWFDNQHVYHITDKGIIA